MSTDFDGSFGHSARSFSTGFSAGLLAATAVCGIVVGTAELRRQADEEVARKVRADQWKVDTNGFRNDVLERTKPGPN